MCRQPTYKGAAEEVRFRELGRAFPEGRASTVLWARDAQTMEVLSPPVVPAIRDRSINRRHVYTEQTASTRTVPAAPQRLAVRLVIASEMLTEDRHLVLCTSNCKIIGHF